MLLFHVYIPSLLLWKLLIPCERLKGMLYEILGLTLLVRYICHQRYMLNNKMRAQATCSRHMPHSTSTQRSLCARNVFNCQSSLRATLADALFRRQPVYIKIFWRMCEFFG